MNYKNSFINNIMIIFSFLLLFIQFWFVRIVRVNSYHPYYMIIGIILMLNIIYFAYRNNKDEQKKRSKRVKWNLVVLIPWIIFCISQIASEMMVPKYYYGIGFLMLFLFTPFYYIWNKLNSEKLWDLFILAVKMTFIGSSIFSFLFREYLETARYSGFLINPNMLGLYLVMIYAIYLSEIYDKICRNSKWTSFLGDYVGFGVCFFLIYMTQARTSLISISFISMFFFILLLKKRVKFLKYYIFTLFVVVVLVFPASYQLLLHVPKLIGHPIQYQKDRIFTVEDDTEYTPVYAAVKKTSPSPDPKKNKKSSDSVEKEENVIVPAQTAVPENSDEKNNLFRIFDSFNRSNPEDISNGRLDIYKEYLKNMNVQGHKLITIRLSGVTIAHAHDNIIQYFYTYGVAGGISYVILLIVLLISSIRYYILHNSKSRHAFFPLCIISSFIIMTITECVFLPFQAFPALIFWVVIGKLFLKEAA